VGYDDPSSAVLKASYILANSLGGAMFWDLPSEDFRQGAIKSLFKKIFSCKHRQLKGKIARHKNV
jgi:GH18 family chitinase